MATSLGKSGYDLLDGITRISIYIYIYIHIHISTSEVPAPRLPGVIMNSKIYCVGKCLFYMGFPCFSNVFGVSEDVNSSFVDHGARGHF